MFPVSRVRELLELFYTKSPYKLFSWCEIIVLPSWVASILKRDPAKLNRVLSKGLNREVRRGQPHLSRGTRDPSEHAQWMARPPWWPRSEESSEPASRRWSPCYAHNPALLVSIPINAEPAILSMGKGKTDARYYALTLINVKSHGRHVYKHRAFPFLVICYL